MREILTEEQQLGEVKDALNITGNYQDKAVLSYMREAKEYLLDAGVSRKILDSTSAIGILARGVSDLWNYGAGNSSLSPYFKERAIQLACKSIAEEGKDG